jgi:hypothetical protein
MPIQAKKKITSNEGYFGSTCIVPRPVPSN